MNWRPIETAPEGERVLVHFRGAGPIVAFRSAERPDAWVRYLGFGKSHYWPTVHEDYATHWMPLPPEPLDVDALAAEVANRYPNILKRLAD